MASLTAKSDYRSIMDILQPSKEVWVIDRIPNFVYNECIRGLVIWPIPKKKGIRLENGSSNFLRTNYGKSFDIA